MKTAARSERCVFHASLIHNGKFIDSRSVLKKSCEYVSEKLKKLLSDAQVKGMENFPFSEIQDIVFTTGTELEFWVKTPGRKRNRSAPFHFPETAGTVLAAHARQCPYRYGTGH